MSKSVVLVVYLFLTTQALYSQQKEDSVRYHFEPVTVTATRVTEGWLGVPLAINILERKNLEQKRGYGLDEILLSVPGVFAQSRYGNQDVRLTIRGFGARGAGARSNAGTSRGIRLLIDGFPETEPDGRTSFDLVDLSNAGSVEIIRSNASAIWGNAAGGVVSISSNSRFEKPFLSFQTMSGDFGFRKQTLSFGTIFDASRFFLSLNNTTYDGWRVHSNSAQTLLNTGVVSQVGERTKLGVYFSATSNIFRIPGPLTQQQFDDDPRQADSVFIRRDERRFNRLGRLGVTLSYEFDDDNSLSVSSYVSPKYLQRSERNRFRDFTRYHLGGSALYRKRFALGSDLKNTLLFGIDEAYQDGAILFYDLTSTGGRGTTLRANKREGANSFGSFFQDELIFSEKVSVLIGGRYDNIAYYYDDNITPKLNDSKSFEHFTPKIGLTLRLSSNHSLYANFGGGVEVPTGNEVDPSSTFGTDTVQALNPLLEPITSTTAEIGMKQVFLSDAKNVFDIISYDVAVYWIEVRNDILPYASGAFYFTAGTTQRYGIELGGQIQFVNGISLSTALTFSKNIYDEYLIDSVHYGNPGKYLNLSDNEMAGVPSAFYNVDVRYAPTCLKNLYVKLGVHGVGSYFADDANRYTVLPYTVVDGVFGVDRLALGDDRFTLSTFVAINNIFDRTYAGSAWINPDLVGGVPVYLEAGLPRNVVASLSFGWNF